MFFTKNVISTCNWFRLELVHLRIYSRKFFAWLRIYISFLCSFDIKLKFFLPLGFENRNSACCGAGKYGGWMTCVLPQMACPDANKYVFWDAFHPTERVNYLTSLLLWNGSVCSPESVEQLAILWVKMN